MILNMTVGEAIAALVAIVAGLVGLIKGLEYLFTKAGRAASKWVQKELAPTNAKIDALGRRIEEVDKKVDASELEDCKNFLVGFLSDIKLGQRVAEVERERFHETYERYKALGGNSYIRTEVERLKKAGKL